MFLDWWCWYLFFLLHDADAADPVKVASPGCFPRQEHDALWAMQGGRLCSEHGHAFAARVQMGIHTRTCVNAI